MDDTIFKQKYKKYKLRVKLWENNFRKKNGRVPSKYDIREAPQEIRDSYKMYYKLKTSFLEDTLNDALADDGYDVLEISQATGCGDDIDDDDACLSFNGGPQLPFDIAAIVEASNRSVDSKQTFSNLEELPAPSALTNLTNRDETDIVKQFEAVEELESNKGAWGDNVSNTLKFRRSDKAQTQLPANDGTKMLKSNLNTKLFQTSSSFSKRNPRKSLSRANLDASLRSTQSDLSESLITPQIALPDLETVLIQKAKEQQTAAAAVATVSSPNVLLDTDIKAQHVIKTQVDDGWLQRSTTQNSMKIADSDCEIDSIHQKTDSIETANKDDARTRRSYGLLNIDLSKIKQTFETEKQEIDYVNPNKTMDSIGGDQESDDIGHQIKKTVKNKLKVIKSDSDSVVSGSESDEQIENFRHRVKRRRLLTTVDENLILTGNSDGKKLDITQTKLRDAFRRTTVYGQSTEKTLSVVNESIEPDSEKDFSADEHEKDADYMPMEKSNAERLKITAKRTKSKTKSKEHKVKTELPKRRSRISKATTTTTIVATEEEMPPSLDHFQSMLKLDSCDITSVPRVNSKELEQVDAVASRYINTMPANASIGGTNSRATGAANAVNEKRAQARRVLEQKIASGRLNENFVRINIEKKRYVRGKKTVNYSKYKKKLWRDKKRVAALTGPDMDMGGCDGGVLKCFTCGQAGHFAQACKVKGDALLPLTAQLEDDPSPFLTLEEVAQMANKSALAVHSGNIAKLPEACNSAMLYNADATEVVNENGRNTDGTKVLNEKNDELCRDTDDDDELRCLDMEAIFGADGHGVESESKISPVKGYAGHKIPEDFLKKAGLDANGLSKVKPMDDGNVNALYDLNEDGTAKEVTSEVLEALHMFGHTSFRKGQDRAIMRILSGLSTLVTLSTGSGKSLCYQLPAYLFSRQKNSITLVVSPLVSLMEDQVTGVPHFLRAHCLHTNQTAQQRLKIMQLIADGEVDILLVSPEAVVAGERSTGFGSILRQLPPIAFACIDEAHCVSQWSHNFRPSYLMICKVLKNNLGVRTILGLTATATLPTRLSIIEHLGIRDGERGIISDIPLPDNLILSVSKDENRDAALLELLNSKRFDACQSIIIYCTRRDECERIAGFLRTCMQDRRQADEKKKRKRVNWQAEPYHAGMVASRRRTIQNAFMKNELRIVVATIAFGMGINKSDIRAVIHYNMPRNFESYVQEIGRAGRDGKPAHCHLFLDAYRGDQNELRRHIYANSIDRHVIRKLLQNIFVPCSCGNSVKEAPMKAITGGNSGLSKSSVEERQRVCPGHEIGFSIESTVEALDIPQENIATLLCYMELDARWHVNVLSSAYIKAKVISYGGARYLKHAAKECPPLAMAIALEIKRNAFKEDANIIEFSVIDIAAAIGWNSGVVKYQLKNLEWTTVNGQPKRSPISVSFTDLGFRLKAPGDFTSAEIDEALDVLYNRAVTQERTQLIQLQYVFQGLSSVSYNNYIPCSKEDYPLERSDQLKAIVREYFRNDYPQDLKLEIEPTTTSDEVIIDDIHALVNMYPENNFSGRNIARIFHGISSPNYPALMWGRCKYWRAHSKIDFNHIVQLANAVIVKWRT